MRNYWRFKFQATVFKVALGKDRGGVAERGENTSKQLPRTVKLAFSAFGLAFRCGTAFSQSIQDNRTHILKIWYQ